MREEQEPMPKTVLSHIEAIQIRDSSIDTLEVIRRTEAAVLAKVWDHRAVMQQALNALWVCAEHNHLHFGDTHNTVMTADAAMKALTEALK